MHDTVYAFDARGSTVHVFAKEGTFVRTIRTSRLALEGPPLGVMSGGRVVGLLRPTGHARESPGTDSVSIRIAARDGSLGRTLGTFAYRESFRGAADRFNRIRGFSPFVAVAVFPHFVCVTYPVMYRIECLDSLGTHRSIIERQTRGRAVSDSMRRALQSGMSGRLPGGNSKLQGSLREHREREAQTIQFAERLPVISRIVPAKTGEVWVADYQPEDGIRTYVPFSPPGTIRTWAVFDGTGRALATIRLPARFRMFDAGENWVLGVSRDEDDVEEVVLLQFRRD